MESNHIEFYKENPSDKVWWVQDSEALYIAFSFDQKEIFYLPRDYHKMTPEQKEIFDKENPFWKEFCGGLIRKTFRWW